MMLLHQPTHWIYISQSKDITLPRWWWPCGLRLADADCTTIKCKHLSFVCSSQPGCEMMISSAKREIVPLT